MDWKNNKKKQEIQKKQGEKILKEENPEYGSLYSIHGSKTEINEKLYEALLKDYLEEEGNHAVNGARISCEYMTDDLQNVKGEIFSKLGWNRLKIGRLFTKNEKSFDVDGQRLATVDDRVSLFEEKCSSIASGTEPAEENVNIYSMGNCGRILPIDYDWVLLNQEEAKKWGTCYCLMQLDEKWDNPPCVENAVDLVLGRDEGGNVVQRYKNMIDRDFCNDATHQPITIGEDEEKVEGLTKMSVLFCKRKKGFITIEWSGQMIHSTEEYALVWLNMPSIIELYDIDNKLVNKLNKIGIGEEKINAVFDASWIIYETYNIVIDPVMMLAILGQEGNGSFNTSSTNKAQDGQNGYEADFALDLIKANDLMMGKVLGYIAYGETFQKVVIGNSGLSGISGSGSFTQYANWNTPIVSIKKESVYPGVYAGHGEWHIGVASFFESIRGEGSTEEYSQYLLSLDKLVLDNILNDVGLDLKDFSFVPNQDSQDSEGIDNGEYTINAK